MITLDFRFVPACMLSVHGVMINLCFDLIVAWTLRVDITEWINFNFTATLYIMTRYYKNINTFSATNMGRLHIHHLGHQHSPVEAQPQSISYLTHCRYV